MTASYHLSWMTSVKTLSPKEVTFLNSWGLGLQHMNFRGTKFNTKVLVKDDASEILILAKMMKLKGSG